MKTTDVPANLREFIKVFNRVAGYRWDAYTVFVDYIDYCIQCFALEKDREWLDKLQDKYGKEYEVFPAMFREMALTMERQIQTDTQWFDVLGTIYEVVASSSKKSGFGQFFTPAEICDLMVLINVPEGMKGKRINDPACGSGRTLLATHAARPGNYFFGEDLDPLCARMCVVNFCLHGVRGQVMNMNTLSVEVFAGWQTDIMCCWPIPKEQSFTWQQMQQRVSAVSTAGITDKPEPSLNIVTIPPAAPGVQLSIF